MESALNLADTQKKFDDAVLITNDNFGEQKKHLPFFARTLFKLLLRIEHGKLYLRFPNGRCVQFNSGNNGPIAKLHLNNWKLPRRVALGGTIGVAESYMDEDWDSPDVTAMLEFFLVNRSIYGDVASQSPVINMIESARHWFNKNTKSGSQKNISAHYDLGNDFYSLWLDPSMTYSSAIYEDGANSLETAQDAKYRNLAENMGITKDSHVLEIGCGWGGFAEYVAREYGAKITGLTISKEQLEYAQKRIEKAGLSDHVDFKFQDYRDETSKYDHVASIEMFEAVGEEYWPTYFGKIKQCLKPGGTVGLQIITIRDAAFEDYRRRPDFIQRYIFPGGMLPSPEALTKVTAVEDLELFDERIFGKDYARTLTEWRLLFWDKWEEVRTLGFDQRFKRMWEFYFHYCEAGFITESIDVRQMFYKHT